MDRNDQILLGAFGITSLTLVMVALATVSGGASSTVAAWVQAFGTVGAVLASGWVANTEARRLRQTRATAAQVAALRLLPAAERIAGRLVAAKVVCSTTNYGLDLLPADPSKIASAILVTGGYEDDGHADFANLPPALVELFLTARTSLERFNGFFESNIADLRLLDAAHREIYTQVAQVAVKEAIDSARSYRDALRTLIHR